MRSLIFLCTPLFVSVGLFAQMGSIAEFDQAQRMRDLQQPHFPATEEAVAPQLYPGEFEDLGPQFLLLAPPPREWLQFYLDVMAYRTSNATLVQSNTGSSDLSVATFEVSIMPVEWSVFGGKLEPVVGLGAQVFRYGFFGDRNKVISGLPVNENDFNALMPFAELTWEKGPWFAFTGVRYSRLYNTTADVTFYTEWMPYWSVGYQLNLSDVSALFLQYEGDYRFSDTESFGLNPPSINDRLDQAILLTYSHLWWNRLVTQLGYRCQFSHYTNAAQPRNDVYNTFALTAGWYFNRALSVRLFTSYEMRNSSASFPASYTNWNVGGGANLTLRF